MKCLKKLLCTVMAVSVIAGAFSVVSASAVEKAQVNSVSIDLNTASYNEQKVKEFVTRLYDICLDRKPDAQGLADWSGQLKNSQATGVSVAYGFIFSAELQGKSLSNEDYIEIMYKAFFGRFIGFANSKEFFKLCSDYGIICGCHVKGKDYKKMAKINLFVERLYEIVLGRECDQGGMLDWSTRLATGKISGVGAAYGFFFSPEYNGQNNTYSKYIEDLYKALMGRPSDQGGKDNWMDKITNGGSKESVFNGFAGSQEFIKICGDYGIERGDLISESTNTTDTLTEEKLLASRKEYVVNSDGKKVLLSEDTFKDGDLIKNVCYDGVFEKGDYKPTGLSYVQYELLSDGGEIRRYNASEYAKYDSNGRLVEEGFEGEGNYRNYVVYDKPMSYVPELKGNTSVTVNALDANGRVTQYKQYGVGDDNKAVLNGEGWYKYDSDGNDAYGEYKVYNYVDGKQMTGFHQKSERTFDSKGNLIEAKEYYMNDETGKWELSSISKNTYTYDANGNLVKETSKYTSYSDGSQNFEFTSTRTYKYDGNGNVITEENEYYKMEYAYDSEGYLISLRDYDKENKYWTTYVYENTYAESAKG